MKKLTQLALITLGSAAFLAVTPAKAQIITQWTFENDAVATNNTPAASTGTGTADAIGMTNSYNSTTSTNTDDVLVGKVTGGSPDTGVNGETDGTHEWRVRGQTPGNGWSSQAPIATQGAQFFTSTAGTTTGAVQVSFDWYVTNQSETNLEFLYTTNGGTSWNNLALNTGSNADISSLTGNTTDTNTVNGAYVSVTANATTGTGQDWFQGLTATINDPSALNDAGFGFELVNASTGADVLGASGGAYNNSSGNWRFDNVTISAVATPEPSSWVLGLASGLAFLAVLRFGRRNARR